MADHLAEKRLEEFLRAPPNASQEEIRAFRELMEGYVTGTVSPDECTAQRLQMETDFSLGGWAQPIVLRNYN